MQIAKSPVSRPRGGTAPSTDALVRALLYGKPVEVPVEVPAVLWAPFEDAVALLLPAEPYSVRLARRMCDSAIRVWGLPDALVDAVREVMSELATNALRHGAPPLCVQLTRLGDDLVVAVYDAGEEMPRTRSPGEWDEERDGPAG